MPARSWDHLRADLAALHAAALAAADPEAAVRAHLRRDDDRLLAGGEAIGLAPASRVWLVALGKASPGMARAAARILGPRLTAGLVAHPHGLDPGADWPPAMSLFPAAHPLPDEGSLRAGAAALELVRGARADDLLLVLVSGGGSALFECLRPGVGLEESRAVTQALQHAGADIHELNVVRRALSLVKGGGLARAAAPARVAALLLSDVTGDRPEAIGSGPTVASPTGAGDALAVLRRHGLEERCAAVTASLRAAATTSAAAAPESGLVHLVGSNRMAGEALAAEAGRRGFRTLLLTDRLQGEAREVGRAIGGLVRGMREAELPLAPPACLILGGETTVTVRGRGRGGRNQELALGAALALAGCPRVAVLSFATDGVDGPTDAAGALVTGETIARARAAGLSPDAALADNDSEPFFRALGDLWITGPTGTNVNDLAVGLVYP